jgi:hypothetical protein
VARVNDVALARRETLAMYRAERRDEQEARAAHLQNEKPLAAEE